MNGSRQREEDKVNEREERGGGSDGKRERNRKINTYIKNNFLE